MSARIGQVYISKKIFIKTWLFLCSLLITLSKKFLLPKGIDARSEYMLVKWCTNKKFILPSTTSERVYLCFIYVSWAGGKFIVSIESFFRELQYISVKRYQYYYSYLIFQQWLAQSLDKSKQFRTNILLIMTVWLFWNINVICSQIHLSKLSKMLISVTLSLFAFKKQK